MSHQSNEDAKGTTIIADKIDAVHRETVEPIAEDRVTAWRCVYDNPKVVLWTLYANIGSTLVGYENLALSVCLAMPAFQMQFASEVDGQLIISAAWQAAWNAMFNISAMGGAVAAGQLQDLFGRRLMFFLGAVCAAAGISIAFASQTSAHFLGAKITTGFSTGLLLTATQTYVSETAPLPMRGLALSVNTVMMNLGFLVAISATYSRVAIQDQSAFRVLFAAAWAMPAALAVGFLFLPESPYYLVMKDRREDARKALVRLSNSREDIAARLEQIQQTIEAERALGAENVSFLECFRGVNWRRTRIILICYYMPQVVGAVLSANAPYFLNQTGLDSGTVIMLVQIGISMGFVSSIFNFLLMMRVNHRPLMFTGVSICLVMYLIMGISSSLPATRTTLMVIGVALEFTSLSYGPAVGASMAVAGEVSASRLRSKSLGIGQAFSGIAGTVWNIIMPYLFNQDQANLGGKIGWIFFAMAILMEVVLFFDVPGTRNRTFEQLDIMFDKKVKARHFETYKFDRSEEI